jgi:hypothetical protein
MSFLRERAIPAWMRCVAIVVVIGAAAPLSGQSRIHENAGPPSTERAAILAVVDSALSFITTGKYAALADLMLPEAQIYSAREREGAIQYRMRTAAQERHRLAGAAVVERGFDAEVRVSGPVAVVWLPYDLYAEGRWSHCGIDIFTMVRVGEAWRIGNLTYSVEQPPACRQHPAGPPPGNRSP